MYFSAIKIIFCLSQKERSDRLRELCEGLALPEDCGCECCSVTAAELFSRSESISVGKDTAILFDSADELKRAKSTFDAFLVLVIHRPEDAPEVGSDNDIAHDIWLLPDSADSGCEGITRIYLRRLINDLKRQSDERRQTICFETLIDSIPDLVWFKDTIGSHLMVNDSFCRAVEKTKQQIYKRGHYYIWDIPKEEYDAGEYVCLESEEVVMDAKKTCLFDEKLKTKSGMRSLKTYKSPLIDPDGEIFGTCGIAHDVTDLHNIGNELEVLIESIPFGVVIEDRSGNILNINRFITKYFPDIKDHIGSSFNEWKSTVPIRKNRVAADEDEFFLDIGGREFVLRFRSEPITDSFGERIGRLDFFRDVTMQYNFEQNTLKNANTDFLTGLGNRRKLFDHLNDLEKGTRLSVISLDLDNFKSVNDMYGHHTGDEALSLTARVLRNTFPDSLTVRLGGDEFLVVIEGECPEEWISEIADKLLCDLRQGFLQRQEFSTLTASAGVAYCRLHGDGVNEVDALMRNSDKALYLAKKTGKNRYCRYSD